MKKKIRGSKVWWFRKVEGWVPKDPAKPNNGQQEKVLIVWRKLTGDSELEETAVIKQYLITAADGKKGARRKNAFPDAVAQKPGPSKNSLRLSASAGEKSF